MGSGMERTAAGRDLPPLRMGLKLAYAIGAIADGVANNAVNIFLFFYVTAVCGLPAALAGVALAAGLVVDAVVDPLIGSLSDSSRSRWGRRIPFMAVGAPGIMLFLILIFSLPAGLSTASLFAYVTALSIGMRVSISLFVLPFNAVGAELSDNYEERSSIATWRWGFAMVGALCAVTFGFGLFFSGAKGLSDRDAYLPFALVMAALVAVAATVAVRALHLTRDRQHPPSESEGRFHARFGREMSEIFRNRSFRALFVGALLLFTALAVHSTLGIHTNIYFWRLPPEQIQLVTLSLFGGLLLGAPFAGPALQRVEKRTVLMVGIVGLGLAYTLPPLLRLLGLFPFTGDALVAALSATVFAGGALMAAAAISFASMMADAADEHEHLFGARREGLYFAGWAFASKAASGFGSLVAGVGLQAIGFPSGAAEGGRTATVQVAPHVVDWLGVIYGPGSGLLAISTAVACLFYRLDKRKHAAILADLEERRAAAADATELQPAIGP
jgi:glycoside/pentoside/hexuronide:cation symporter, GPH family